MDENKSKALELAIAKIEKDFGKGSIMKLGEDRIAGDIPVIPTGSISLDIALGIGGLPRGRIIEIYGAESSGKTTIALHCIAQVQKQDGVAAFVDAEHALDPHYAQEIGVDIESLLVSQPDNGETALEIVETLVRSSGVDVVVVDSVAALVPQQEIDGDMGDSHMALQARLMSQALRKLTAIISKTNCTVIFINQVRSKIGVMFGNPETTTGGNALKFYASARIEVKKSQSIKEKDEVIGTRVNAKVVKNKMAAPFKTAEFCIYYGEGERGINREASLLEYGVELEFIQKSGSWYTMGDEKLGQGAENARLYLKDHPDVADRIEKSIREVNNIVLDEKNVLRRKNNKNAPAPANNHSHDDVEFDGDTGEVVEDGATSSSSKKKSKK